LHIAWQWSKRKGVAKGPPIHMQKVKVKGHSVQKLDRETDGQTEATALPPVLTRWVTSPPNVIWDERVATPHASCTNSCAMPTTDESNHSAMGTLPSPSPWGMWTPSNTTIPRPTPLTIPNGIRIQSAMLPQYTFRTHRP